MAATSCTDNPDTLTDSSPTASAARPLQLQLFWQRRCWRSQWPELCQLDPLNLSDDTCRQQVGSRGARQPVPGGRSSCGGKLPHSSSAQQHQPQGTQRVPPVLLLLQACPRYGWVQAGTTTRSTASRQQTSHLLTHGEGAAAVTEWSRSWGTWSGPCVVWACRLGYCCSLCGECGCSN